MATPLDLDDTTRERLEQAARTLQRSPHGLIEQAILSYLEQLERGLPPSAPPGRCDDLSPAPPGAWGRQLFLDFAQRIQPQSVLRAAITAAYRRPEPEALAMLLEQARLPEPLAGFAQKLALDLAERLRKQTHAGGRQGLVQGLLQEFSLSSQEGVALMCLAEALLRIPDRATRDALIRDKISNGNWSQHLGHSPSPFVNAAAWGLLISGRLVSTHNEAGLSSALNRIIGKSGEPLIRQGVNLAMRLMGEQFVTGQTIAEALANAARLEARGFRYSYDMLGEAALTAADARRYLAAYQQAIHAIGRAADGRGIYQGPGISIKLSALHPRYARAQHARVMEELYPSLLGLAQLARQYTIGLNIDAEEADRLELSLDLLERLCFEPSLAGWDGIGFVIQAYQKRCPHVIDQLIDLARRSRRRLMIRLVKGAYWDSEIKAAQVNGLEGYPVYTRKPYTDVSYLACARKLLAVPEAVYPQFATHNAHSLASIYHLAGSHYSADQYEFQCLHGMGEPLYEQVVGSASDGKLGRPCRIYAPVGSHETLLAYLVRRLLENGANTSFVNRVADPAVPLQELVQDPLQQVLQLATQEGALGLPHPHIPLPRALYGDALYGDARRGDARRGDARRGDARRGDARLNSAGLDLSNEQRLASLAAALLSSTQVEYRAQPILAEPAAAAPAAGELQPVRNPADRRDLVGTVQQASEADIEQALRAAWASAPLWQSSLPGERAALLERAADLLEAQTQPLMGLLVREAGKSLANAIAEVREAVDFLRYYAAQVRASFSNHSHRPLGPVVCISPWNFPLAIFTGQIAAALAAGNTVLAKPAEQTPLIADAALRLLLQAGIPAGALQLLPGRGETVGARLVADPRVCGVLFTGSTAVARHIQRALAGRLDAQGRSIPLIAETGGLNAMLVDSSALTEQVVTDVIASAFDSAGQRCSALRVLCVQEEVAGRVVEMLKGAMAECRLGNPGRLCSDIGPVIDGDARTAIEQHIQAMRERGRPVFQLARFAAEELRHGTFVVPTLIELQRFDELRREVFGPVLHLLRYRRERLGALLAQINASGYGLTMGLHTRIDETIARVVDSARVGNLYVNRNMVGAVVGVQPFGGEGLSGTGPKAGGPLYLYRLLATRPQDAVARLLPRQATPATPPDAWPAAAREALEAFADWASDPLQTLLGHYRSLAQAHTSWLLRGPTGERNSYHLLPRERVLCLADARDDALVQLAACLALGCQLLWVDGELQRELHAALPRAVQARIRRVADWSTNQTPFDAVLHHGEPEQLRAVSLQVAQRPGPIIAVHGLPRGATDLPLERLLVERALSVNTAAAGGNASLMTIG